MSQSIYTLLCKKDLPMAMVTLPGLVRFLKYDQLIYVFDDGSFTSESTNIITNLSEKIKVITRNERESLVTDSLNNYPNCKKYRNDFPLGFKLLDIPIFVKSKNLGRFTYTDSDIIYINNCEDYFNRNTNTYLMTDGIKLSFKLQNGLLNHRWKIPYKFNSGYFSYDIIDYDLDFIEYYLGLHGIHNIPWLSEQACWALLFGRSGKSYCPQENEFICKENFSGPMPDTLAIHLIGKLKPFYKEWSIKGEVIKDISNTPSFELSRNVTIVDWLLKSARRFF